MKVYIASSIGKIGYIGFQNIKTGHLTMTTLFGVGHIPESVCVLKIHKTPQNLFVFVLFVIAYNVTYFKVE